MRYLAAIAIVELACSQVFAADATPKNSRGVESLGNELLDDLTPNAFDQPATQPNKANDGQPENGSPVTRAPRFDDLGEDIGQATGSLSLLRVRLGMQQAESLLGNKKAAADAPTLEQAGEAQQQVVAQLDKLIAELSKQCQSCGQCQSPSSEPMPGQTAKKKPGKSGSPAARGQAAARDSSDRLNPASAQAADKGNVEAMVKDLWGHLPERSREQMMQTFSEEFLPQYQLEIEQYYRRLSEEHTEKGPQ